MKSWTRALIVIGPFLLPSLAFAQSAPPASSALVPGSADVIHDVLGIAIGMPCDDAILKAKDLFTGKYDPRIKLGWLSVNPMGGQVKFDQATIRVSYTEYTLVLHDRFNKSDTSNTEDFMIFSCLEDGENREVISLHRQIRYLDPKLAPNTASLVGVFQEKYGVPSIKFSPTFLATMFSQTGILSTAKNDCGEYQNGTFYKKGSLGFIDLDTNKCSYTLTFHAVEATDPPGAISSINIDILDILRFGNKLRAMEKHRLESTPTVVPKL